jgi:sugar lactone lactonase YvrE
MNVPLNDRSEHEGTVMISVASNHLTLTTQTLCVMKNLISYRLMNVTVHYLRVAFFMLVVSLPFSCEGPFADEQAFSKNPNNLREANLMTKGAALTCVPGEPQLLVTGLQSGSGSTIGPDGALYVTEGATGRILRVDPETGDVSTFASGLPPFIVGIGGLMDVVFRGQTAYAIVTIVGPQFGTNDVVGIYRIDGPDTFTVIADIGAFALANPPETAFFVEMGVQYSIETYRGGFLVTDGHHNRVLYVTLDGEISEFRTFDNIVPTGLAISGNTVYMAEAGPIPHLPENGKVVSFDAKSNMVTTVASGARLVVDVEFGRGQTLFALSQGIWDGVEEGSPAEPNTGSLLRVNADGTFSVIATGLDRPTSLEFIGTTAYIVTLAGEVWTIENVGCPPFGNAGLHAK